MQFGKIDLMKKQVKLFLSYPHFRRIFSELENCNNDCAVLIGTPIHGNLGDHLIGLEALEYLDTLHFSNLIEIPEFVYEIYHKNIKKVMPKKAMIFITGGGWMGDTYEDELVIEDILDRYTNKVIIFPQTVFFERDSDKVRRLSELIKKTNPIICLREKNSYNFIRNRLGVNNNSCLLLPDLALLHETTSALKMKQIIVSLRDDAEDIKRGVSVAASYKDLEQAGYQIIMSSSVIASKLVRINEREEVVNRKIKEFAKAELVITDRLHSMIMAMLAGTKCIALDNLTHKVKGCYELWLSSNPNITFLDNASLLTSELIHNTLKKKYEIVNNNYLSYYDVLTNKINEVRKHDK